MTMIDTVTCGGWTGNRQIALYLTRLRRTLAGTAALSLVALICWGEMAAATESDVPIFDIAHTTPLTNGLLIEGRDTKATFTVTLEEWPGAPTGVNESDFCDLHLTTLHYWWARAGGGASASGYGTTECSSGNNSEATIEIPYPNNAIEESGGCGRIYVQLKEPNVYPPTYKTVAGGSTQGIVRAAFVDDDKTGGWTFQGGISTLPHHCRS